VRIVVWIGGWLMAGYSLICHASALENETKKKKG